MTRGFASLLLLVVLFHARSANAQDAAPTLVVVAAVGSADDVASLEASLRELVGRLGLRLEVQRGETPVLGSGPRPLTTVRVDLRGGGDVTVVIERGRTGEVLARRRVPWTGSAAVVIEATAHVIQASVEDVREIEKATPPVPPPPPPAEPPVITPPEATEPSPKEASTFALDLAAFFGGRAFGESNFAALGGAAATARRDRGQWSPGLAVSAAYHTPFDAKGTLVELRTRTLTLRLAPSLEVYRGASWFLEAGAGGGLDVFFTSPRSSSVPVSQLGADRTDVAPVATGLFAAHLSIASGADVFAMATLDLDIAPRRWVTNARGVHEAVFSPARLRPALVLGVSFGVLGPDLHPRQASPTIGRR